jgi:hypothetical protein
VHHAAGEGGAPRVAAQPEQDGHGDVGIRAQRRAGPPGPVEPADAVLGRAHAAQHGQRQSLLAALGQLHGGLGAGPAMAFLTTGAGTSIGAISGTLLIARRRVVGLVVACLLAGAVVLGWTASAVLG